MEIIAAILLSIGLFTRFVMPVAVSEKQIFSETDKSSENNYQEITRPTTNKPSSFVPDNIPAQTPIPTAIPTTRPTPFIFMEDCKLESGEIKNIPTTECYSLKIEELKKTQQNIVNEYKNTSTNTTCIVGNNTYSYMNADECKKAQDDERKYQEQQALNEKAKYQAFYNENATAHLDCLARARNDYSSIMSILAANGTADSSTADQALVKRDEAIAKCVSTWEAFTSTHPAP